MRSPAMLLMVLLCLGLAMMAVAAPPDSGSAATPGEAIVATLAGSWLVTIEGEARSRTLTVFGLAPTGFGARGDTHTINAVYGYTDSTHSPVKVVAAGALEDLQIMFRSSAGAQVQARTAANGEMHGTFEFKGQKRSIVIKRAPITAAARRDSKITLVYVGAFN